MIRLGLVLVGGLGLLSLTGCTAKYQQRILDQNEMIVKYRTQLSDLRLEHESCLTDLGRLRKENEAIRRGVKSAPVPSNIRKKPVIPNMPSTVSTGIDPYDGLLTIGIPASLTFQAGSKDLIKEGQQILRKVAKVLKQKFGKNRIYVLGHTDNQDLKKTKKLYLSNHDLSAQRASAVQSYLVKCGVQAKKMVVMGFGPARPKQSNKTEKGRQANRRVEIKISPK